VQLVDGGVHDNQGVEGLYDRNCTHLIVSDASGQMTDDADPTGSTLGALVRESSIQGDRMREQELLRLDGPTSAVLHLRNGLAPRVVPYLRPDGTEDDAPALPSTTGGFHVDPRVQDLLSRVRTDLDAFSEVEACSLMLDGYLIAGAVVPRRLATDAGDPRGLGDLMVAEPAAPAEPWGFLRMAPLLADPSAPLLHHLTVASGRFLKAARLVPAMWGVLALLAAVPAALLALAVAALWDPVLTRPVSVGWVVVTAILVLAVVLVPYFAHRVRALRWLRGPLDWVVRQTTWTVLAPLFWLIAQVALRIFDPVFLRAGRVDRLAPEGAARE
jgi:NTE family protein